MEERFFKNGSKIGVFAPSSYVEKSDIEAGCEVLSSRGFEVFVHPQTYERYHQSAGTHTQKIEALHSLYQDDSVDAIWAAGGGNRAMHIVELLDYDLIKAHAKPMIGFSDVTALINAISIRCGFANLHGPVFKNLSKHQEIDSLLSHDFEIAFGSYHILREGAAEGLVFGGNLSIFQYLPNLLGKEFLNDSILILEDCNEEISRIDRMFMHMKHIGVFERISGLVLGEFTQLKDDGSRPFGFTLKDIIIEMLGERNIPVIMNAPFGHGDFFM